MYKVKLYNTGYLYVINACGDIYIYTHTQFHVHSSLAHTVAKLTNYMEITLHYHKMSQTFKYFFIYNKIWNAMYSQNLRHSTIQKQCTSIDQ